MPRAIRDLTIWDEGWSFQLRLCYRPFYGSVWHSADHMHCTASWLHQVHGAIPESQHDCNCDSVQVEQLVLDASSDLTLRNLPHL